MAVQALVSQTAVEALDERVVGRLARPREVERDAVLVRPPVERLRADSGPLSTRLVLGAPRASTMRVIASTTCSLLMPWSTLIVNASLVNASTTVSARNRRPSNNASETKSIDHISSGADAAGWRSRFAALTLRRGRLSRRLSPSSR